MNDYLKKLDELEDDANKLHQSQTLSWYLAQIRHIVSASMITPDLTTPPEDQKKAKDEKYTTTKTEEGVPSSVVLGTASAAQTSMIGQLLCYSYDPKLKSTLPYYDTFPMIFMIAFYGDSFLGMNMHYLPPWERATLFNALESSLINTKDVNEKTRLDITYQILKGSSRYQNFKPCIKKYLLQHVKSQVVIIQPKDWPNVVMMPLARFQKATQFKVWQDSVSQISSRKR